MVDMNITQPSFSSGIISTEMFSRLDFSKLSSGLKQCENFVIRPAGGAIYRVGTRYICEAKYPDKNVALIPFVFSRDDGLCLEFGDKYVRFYKSGMRLENEGVPYELETPYLESEVMELKFCQNKNDLYVVHNNHPPALLRRNSDIDWSYRELELNPKVPEVGTITLTVDKAKNEDTVVDYDGWQYAISVVDKDNHEGFAKYSDKVTADIDLLNQPITVKWNRPNDYTNIKEFRVYRFKAGEFYLAYVQEYDGKSSYTFKDISFQLDTSKSPKQKFDAFDDGNYPCAVGMWNQRLILGGTKKKPSTFWMSRVGFPEDFTRTIVNAADDGIELTFNSGTLDAILDFVPMDDLIVFTEGKIWRVSGTSVNNMTAFVESYSGSCGLRPFATKKSVLFVDNSRNTVSNFVYSYELNGYTGQNLDTLTRQLLDGYVIDDISYRDTPYGVMYSVRNDGTLLGLTYMREENIYAWHQHTTKDGKFRAVCSVDGDQEDSVYVAVSRFGKMFIEMFASYINEQQDINDAMHLDCATKLVSDVWSYQTTRQVEDETEKNLFEAKSSGVYSVKAPEDGWYTIILVGGGGGGSGKWGAAGGYVKIIAKLSAGTYTVIVGKGGSGALAYVRNHDGGNGNSSVFSGNGITITAVGGAGRHGDRGGDTLLSGNPRVIVSGSFDYDILEKNLDVSQQASFYQGYGAGGQAQPKDTGAGYAGTDGYCKIIMQSKTYSYEPGDYLYTNGEPHVGDRAYPNINVSRFETITNVDENNNITVGGKVYELKSKSAPNKEEVDGLERFEGQNVCAVLDGNVFDVYVEDGKAILPYESANVTIGLRYEGIIETIPSEFTYNNGSSTVGGMRKINDGTLMYYRSRGLWYGRDYNHLYEIKPYTGETFGEQIPLESGKLTLKVADGYSIENSFMVVQRSPMPALVQSITLGSTYNGKS